ncbi:MAG: hypothetical protein FWG57_01320 [Endomicrobia bacterium]|nr:hypothetical protein [Endomicrobiia bacterium]
MVLSIYFLSLLFFILGWIYYYKPSRVQKINNFFREKIFNDRYLLLKRKKIAVVFFMAACLLFTSGFIKSQDEKKKISIQIESEDKEVLFDAIASYNKRLAEQPEDVIILTKLAVAYKTLGENNRASLTRKRILALNQKNRTVKEGVNVKR